MVGDRCWYVMSLGGRDIDEAIDISLAVHFHHLAMVWFNCIQVAAYRYHPIPGSIRFKIRLQAD